MRSWVPPAADVACVVVFVAVGRVSHAEGLALAGLAATAWPFLAGTLLAHLRLVVARRLLGRFDDARRGAAGLVAGLLVWVTTVVVGMLARSVFGAGVQLSFVVTTAIVLGVFLLGWRAVLRLVDARRAVATART